MTHPQVVQARGRFHEAIGAIWTRIAQRVFHTARALDAANRVLDSDAHAGQSTIAALLGRRQFALARLFLGCKVRRTQGSYP
jgi:phage gp16-like protein